MVKLHQPDRVGNAVLPPFLTIKEPPLAQAGGGFLISPALSPRPRQRGQVSPYLAGEAVAKRRLGESKARGTAFLSD
jgi:hypothetical protein